VLLLVGVYGMAAVAGLNLHGPTWLIWGQALFVVSESQLERRFELRR
jgi:hypothetical protein